MIEIYEVDLYIYFAVFFILSITAISLFKFDKVTRKRILELAQEKNISDLKFTLRYLFRTGVSGASLVVSFPKYDLTIRFDKYIRAKGIMGICFIVPDDYLAIHKLGLLETFCREQAISWPVSKTLSDEQIGRRLDCGPDIEKAFRLLHFLVVEVEQIPETVRYVCTFTGGRRPGEIVDDPETKPVSAEEAAILEKKARRTHVSGSILIALKNFIMTVSPLVGTMGMIFGLLISVAANIFGWQARWAVIEVSMFGLSLQPKIFDLIFMGLYFVGVTKDISAKDFHLSRSAVNKKSLANAEPKLSMLRAGTIWLRDSRVTRRAILIGLLVASWFWH